MGTEEKTFRNEAPLYRDVMGIIPGVKIFIDSPTDRAVIHNDVVGRLVEDVDSVLIPTGPWSDSQIPNNDIMRSDT
jgi:hypothetical protein